MLYVMLMLIAGLGLTMVLTQGGRTSPTVRIVFAQGLDAWGRFLPALALGLLALVLAGNLFGRFYAPDAFFSLRGLMSRVEILVLLVTLPLFLTPLAHGVGFILTFYVFVKTYGAVGADTPAAVPALLMGYTTLAMLGDKLFAGPRPVLRAGSLKFRSGMGMLLAIGAIFVILLTLPNLAAFTAWANTVFQWGLPSPVVFLGLIALFTAWVFVALGVHLPFLLPMIILPTLIPMAFATGWAPAMSLVPFMIAISLVLTSFERALGALPGNFRLP